MTVITVSQLNNYIKKCFDSIDVLNGIYIKGEISNFKHHSSGHIYMTLKDKQSALKCVMFSTEARNLKFLPKDGMKVIALGRISVYERDGVYQLYVNELIPDGKGDLYVTSGGKGKQLVKNVYSYQYANDKLIYYIKNYSLVSNRGDLYRYDGKSEKIQKDVYASIATMPEGYDK